MINNSTAIKSILVLIFGLVSCSSVYAGGSYSMDGVVNNQNGSKPNPVNQNLVLVDTLAIGEMDLADQNNPLHGASGTCNGSILINAGAITGSGHCAFKDADGDTSVVSWQATAVGENGVSSGEWQFTAGTGKFANSSGGGTYSNVPSADNATTVNTLTGTLNIE